MQAAAALHGPPSSTSAHDEHSRATSVINYQHHHLPRHSLYPLPLRGPEILTVRTRYRPRLHDDTLRRCPPLLSLTDVGWLWKDSVGDNGPKCMRGGPGLGGPAWGTRNLRHSPVLTGATAPTACKATRSSPASRVQETSKNVVFVITFAFGDVPTLPAESRTRTPMSSRGNARVLAFNAIFGKRSRFWHLANVSYRVHQVFQLAVHVTCGRQDVGSGLHYLPPLTPCLACPPLTSSAPFKLDVYPPASPPSPLASTELRLTPPKAKQWPNTLIRDWTTN
ncbi:hypothetical protein GALMADRAFT_143255 [Galerina marginata CBS 339.88]|uniref:Uncharacterized protein n=1 Tax=Galerina marginata (strain CBS 339.88) TaxID=685588 RepID=A0A067T0B4_GALM3|nr:hypothetical protein GALMADRAFT_143255 [Galerina marginata CBS 339.88]